jgi:hypothetical protein
MLSLMFAAAFAGAAAFDAQVVPKAEADIAAACGAKPKVAVRWDGFGEDPDAAEALTKAGLDFLTQAFAEVCKDPALKPEVAKQIKRIVLTQAYGAADPVVYIAEGALNVEYLWVKGEVAPDAAFVGAEIAARLKGEEMEAP